MTVSGEMFPIDVLTACHFSVLLHAAHWKRVPQAQKGKWLKQQKMETEGTSLLQTVGLCWDLIEDGNENCPATGASIST